VKPWSRRKFTISSIYSMFATTIGVHKLPHNTKSKVGIVKVGPGGREEAILRAAMLIELSNLSKYFVALKPNLCCDKEYPYSSHIDTIDVLVRMIKGLAASKVVIADRSIQGITRNIMSDKGILQLAQHHYCDILPLDELDQIEDWIHIDFADLHWNQGFYLARIFNEVNAIIQTCCLNTYDLGVNYSLSLGTSIGMIAETVPGLRHNFMDELNTSNIRHNMIAEINLSFQPLLVILDAIEYYSSHNNNHSRLVTPGVILASSDRVAIDTVAIAIIKYFTNSSAISEEFNLKLDQLAWAAEIGLGINNPRMIDLITSDQASLSFANSIQPILHELF